MSAVARELVKRYAVNENYSCSHCDPHYPWDILEPEEYGEYVLASDYDALEARLLAAEARNVELYKLLDKQTNEALYAYSRVKELEGALPGLVDLSLADGNRQH